MLKTRYKSYKNKHDFSVPTNVMTGRNLRRRTEILYHVRFQETRIKLQYRKAKAGRRNLKHYTLLCGADLQIE